MARNKKRRTRKKRRQAKQSVKHGSKAKPKHKVFFGRTGQSMESKNPSKKKHEFIVIRLFKVPQSLIDATLGYKKR